VIEQGYKMTGLQTLKIEPCNAQNWLDITLDKIVEERKKCKLEVEKLKQDIAKEEQKIKKLIAAVQNKKENLMQCSKILLKNTWIQEL